MKAILILVNIIFVSTLYSQVNKENVIENVCLYKVWNVDYSRLNVTYKNLAQDAWVQLKFNKDHTLFFISKDKKTSIKRWRFNTSKKYIEISNDKEVFAKLVFLNCRQMTFAFLTGGGGDPPQTIGRTMTFYRTKSKYYQRWRNCYDCVN